MRYYVLKVFLISLCMVPAMALPHRGASAQSPEQLKQYNTLHKENANGDSRVLDMVRASRGRENSIEFTLVLLSTIIILALFAGSVKKRGDVKSGGLLGALLSLLFIYTFFNLLFINATHPPTATLLSKIAGAGIILSLVASFHM
ncbi:MAG: hypothetical protein GY859_17705, partial [Desulfobacterales bacterium]|nr:hypothetical protein [Desulfobacterales bacterium]